MTSYKPFLALLASAMAVIAFSAFGVSAAAASTTEECRVPEPGEEPTAAHFIDSNCEIKGGPETVFRTVKVKENSVLKRTSTITPIFHTKLHGIPTEISCEAMSGNKTVSNQLVEGKPGFVGEGKMVFSGCVVSAPPKCSVNSSSFETVLLSESSEDLKEAQRTLFAPKEGTKLATIALEGEGCEVSGTYTVEGKLRSQTVDIHTEEFGLLSGSEAIIKGGLLEPTSFEPAFFFHDATASTGKTIVRELP
jgi:hypothetical protein